MTFAKVVHGFNATAAGVAEIATGRSARSARSADTRVNTRILSKVLKLAGATVSRAQIQGEHAHFRPDVVSDHKWRWKDGAASPSSTEVRDEKAPDAGPSLPSL